MDAFYALQVSLIGIAAFVAVVHFLSPSLLRFPTVRPPSERAYLKMDPDTPHRYGWVLRGAGKGLLAPTWRFTAKPAWVLYAAHQATHWFLVSYAQFSTTPHTYSGTLHWVNIIALATNAFFMIAHVIQTHTTYDALAQDVPEYSAQYAVLIMVCVMMIIENPFRGLIWGWHAPIDTLITELFSKYHGYFFSWALIFTFWFHPCDTGLGLLSGFSYLLCILLQGSLFFTSVHVHPTWRVVHEVGLVLHASCVSLEQARAGSGWKMFQMFATGTGVLVVLTYQHGLGWGTQAKLAVVGVYLILVSLTFRKNPTHAPLVMIIPGSMYLVYLPATVAMGWIVVTTTESRWARCCLLTAGMICFSCIHGVVTDVKAQRKAKRNS